MSLMTADIVSACIMLIFCSIVLFYAVAVSQKQDEEIAKLKANQKPLK